MSKFEVLQNNKISREVQKLSWLKKWIIKARYSESVAMIGIIDIHRIVIDMARIWGGVRIGFEVLQWSLTLGDFVLFWTLMKVLADNIEKANLYVTDAFQQYVNIEKLRSQFDEIPSIKGLYDGKDITISEWTIHCKNICFWYEHDSDLFKNFSCVFEGGKKTALVGVSGTWKSSIVKLLSGYILPDDGVIEVDWQLLQDVSLISYYKHIGYLTQEPNVFDGTIRDNMLYGLPDDILNEEADSVQQRLDAALRMAKCDFVYEFSEWLDTEIGEKGIRLSWGQRQRLAIAKIFLKNPKIIILDEPTSALDSFSEEAITEAMHNLFQGRTVIIIAHRLQTVKAADDIIVLDKQPGEGVQVIERGTHEELVKKGGYYARMLEVQTGF